MRLLTTASLVALLAAGASFAQTGQPSQTQPQPSQTRPGAAAPTGTPAPGAGHAAKLGEADRKFHDEAAEGGLAEVELGKLALQKGEAPSVKQFGELMVKDHSAANQQLMAIGTHLGLAAPTKLDPEHQTAQQKLTQATGRAFDREYINAMVKDHEKDVKAFEQEAASGGNPELKQFATNTLPILRHHLQEAQRIQKELASQSG